MQRDIIGESLPGYGYFLPLHKFPQERKMKVDSRAGFHPANLCSD
jgi:hypothetical protein